MPLRNGWLSQGRENHEKTSPLARPYPAVLPLRCPDRRKMRQERGGAGSGECGKVGNGKPGYSPAAEGGLRWEPVNYEYVLHVFGFLGTSLM